MNKTILEIKKAVDQHKEDLNFNKFCNELFRIFKNFNLEGSKQLLDLNEDKKPYNQVEKFENLTFLDGVLLTWTIFNKILDKRLRDENGNPEKDKNGYDYLGIINDDITDLLLNKVLEHNYFKFHGEHLRELFEIGPNAYVCPAWMRNKN